MPGVAGYVGDPGPEDGLALRKGIEELPPAHMLILKDGHASLRAYWSIGPKGGYRLSEKSRCGTRPWSTALDPISRTMLWDLAFPRRARRRRLRSSRKPARKCMSCWRTPQRSGCTRTCRSAPYRSGGLDSSAVAALAARRAPAGLIDSTGILELVAFVEDTLGITVADAEILPANFDSITRVAEFVARKRTTAQAG